MFNEYFFHKNDFSAAALIKGGPETPEIFGVVKFYEIYGGSFVCVTVNGLPPFRPATDSQPQIGPFGFHLHENGICDYENEFESAGSHWNPNNQPHGNHAGDFPVLFSNNGYAHMCFFTNKFKPNDVLGKSVIIHQSPDNYSSQPAGNSGKRIACGVIKHA